MLLTVLFCLGVLYFILLVDHQISKFLSFQKDIYGSAVLGANSVI